MKLLNGTSWFTHLLFLAITISIFSSCSNDEKSNNTAGTNPVVVSTVTTDIGALNDSAYAVAIQTDGKIIAAGEAMIGSPGSSDFALVRYNTDGSLDTTFGTGGKVTTDIGTSNDSAFAVAIQTDGKIIAAGKAMIGSPGSSDFALVRHNTDGSLDMTFGTGGKVTTDIGTSNDSAFAVAIQTDGKIIAVGEAMIGSPGSSDFALVRYNTDGSLDTTFGTGGKVTTDIGTKSNSAYAIAIQADKKIVVAGAAIIGSSGSYDFALVRYNTDGSLDTSFGTNGMVTTNIGTMHDIAYAVAIQTDGKIIAAGKAMLGAFGSTNFALIRYNSDGGLDPAFGSGGKVTTAFGSASDAAYAVAIQTDGKIVAAGEMTTSFPGYYDFALARYNTNGSLDSGFGTGGKISTPVGFTAGIGSLNDSIYAIAIKADGQIAAVGEAMIGSPNYYDFALALYFP